MDPSRRHFIGQSAALLAGMPMATSMRHVILLGDSIFDNKSYTGGKPDVITQLRGYLPAGWQASLLAIDGATTEGISSQLTRLPSDASHLVLSVGGNDALRRSDILDKPVRSTADAFDLLATIRKEFELAYRKAVSSCLKRGLPLTLCTIYNGNFPDQNFQRRAATALAVFNDTIIRVGAENKLTVIELRQICAKPEDYANPIEPSSIGGAKIARAISRVVTEAQTDDYRATVVA